MRNTSTRRMVVGGLLVCGLLGGAQAQLFYTNSGGYWAAAAGSSTNSWTNQAGAATALANFSNIVFNTAGINTNNMATGGSYGWVTWTVANVTNAVSSGANSYYFTGFTNSGGGTVYFASKVTFSNQSIAPIIYNNGQLTFTNVMTNLNTSSAITFESSVGATTTVSGVMGSNNMGVVKNGLGTLYLNAANTYRGNTTNNDGTLKLGNNAALGTGTLVINGGKLDVNGARTNTNAQIWNGDWEFVGSSTLISTGAVTLGGNRIVTVTASTLTEGGVIGEGGIGYSLTKAGAGTLVLTNANTYSGGTIISNGTLVANNNNALGGGLLTMSGGVLSNSVNSSLTNAINLSVASTIGVLSANTLTLSGVITNSGGLTKAGAGTAAELSSMSVR
ncbi:MAG: autotransporter-associated beta strand repeat-containing protein [Kiritimatiellaeota bacterium]|nr:autotransporter-associated beta strand repeat-containing protein [Kiritimatiellota bacterium]